MKRRTVQKKHNIEEEKETASDFLKLKQSSLD